MLFALNENGDRISICSAKKTEEYFCPQCGCKLILKMGSVRHHHFAHPNTTICNDSWHYDMTEWHYEWQNKFPKEYQEIVKVADNQKHRADILIEDSKVVIEFQHSPLSPTEFEDRNTFYNKLGYRVVWIFDVEDQYQNDLIDNYKGNIWSWKHHKRTFDCFDYRNKMVDLFLQLDNSTPSLIKVTWCTDENGLSKFATDGKFYDEDYILHNYDQKNEFPLSQLKDKLIKLNSKDHTTYYFGCPISSTHKCANNKMEISKNMYSEIMPCEDCKYAYHTWQYDEIICNKRFIDLSLDPDTLVKIESKDKYGFINKISYLENNTRKIINLPAYESIIFKNIFSLWEDNHVVAIFKNIRTNNYVKIIKNPKEQLSRYHRVYGYFSSDPYSFPQQSKELYDLNEPEWIITWSKKHT